MSAFAEPTDSKVAKHAALTVFGLILGALVLSSGIFFVLPVILGFIVIIVGFPYGVGLMLLSAHKRRQAARGELRAVEVPGAHAFNTYWQWVCYLTNLSLLGLFALSALYVIIDTVVSRFVYNVDLTLTGLPAVWQVAPTYLIFTGVLLCVAAAHWSAGDGYVIAEARALHENALASKRIRFARLLGYVVPITAMMAFIVAGIWYMLFWQH